MTTYYFLTESNVIHEQIDHGCHMLDEQMTLLFKKNLNNTFIFHL